MIKTSWKLIQELDETYQLFYDKVDTNYFVNIFLCSCGEKHIVISNKLDEINYICINCENNIFYDANLANKSFNFFLYKNKSFQILEEYEIKSIDNNIVARTFMQIPITVDIVSEKVFYVKKDIYSLTLDLDGNTNFIYQKENFNEYKEDNSLKTLNEDEFYYYIVEDEEIFGIKDGYDLIKNEREEIKLNFEKNIVSYVQENKMFDVERINEYEKLNFSQLVFMLKNKNILDRKIYYFKGFEFYEGEDKLFDFEKALSYIRHNRNEKSVKKAVYNNFSYQMKEYNHFKFEAIYYITELFFDVNIITQLIYLKLEELNINYFKFIFLINFMKKFYTEIQIYNFLKHCKNNKNKETMMYDIIEMCYILDENLIDYFQKVKCNINLIHDEFHRCYNLQQHKDFLNINFTYTKNELNRCFAVKDYDILLPKNGKELLDIGNIMKNCITSYYENIYNKKTIIYIFMKNKYPQFAVELIDDKITQASGYTNRKLNIYENEVLKIWYKNFNERLLLNE